MPTGYAYHRLAEGKEKVIYPCSRCGSRAEEIVEEGKGNKYTHAGLCRACFEIGVEVSRQGAAIDKGAVQNMPKRKGIYQYAMWIPFSSAMQREGILNHLKAAVEILIEGPQERIEEIIEKRQDTVAGFVRQIWEAIKNNPP